MTCHHLQEFKTKFGVGSYKILCRSFILSKHRHSNRQTPLYNQVWISCFKCENKATRILACLHCIYLGCVGPHIEEHMKDKDHLLWKRNCGDPVQYVKWRPSSSEEIVLKRHSRLFKLQSNHSEESSAVEGVRGIFNLGNTCFMNCIMQALLHTPMLRDYFFTDKHKCYAPRKSECFVCNFAQLFQKYYTEDRTASLHETLFLLWQNAKHLSGYGQKDAHEFFSAVLNLLHQYSTPKSPNVNPCNCIVDVIFHGEMQSDLVCQSCGNISTKIDPIWDISLDIPDPPTAASLFDCLYHYTRAEPLDSSTLIECTVCETHQESTKQFTFKMLPIVIVIHLKRFDAMMVDDLERKKKTTYVPFPGELDMSPFMSGYRNQSDKEGQKKIRKMDIPELDNRYSLYAVIVHKGDKLYAGHYIAYIRHTSQKWFQCSDDCVVPAKVKEVMESQGYLLFYHKTVLTYN